LNPVLSLCDFLVDGARFGSGHEDCEVLF
jgi:hypothetical protein